MPRREHAVVSTALVLAPTCRILAAHTVLVSVMSIQKVLVGARRLIHDDDITAIDSWSLPPVDHSIKRKWKNQADVGTEQSIVEINDNGGGSGGVER